MTFLEQYKTELTSALEHLDQARIEQAIAWFAETRDRGGRIFVCGNGGSAATASHFACDIQKGASFGRERRFRLMALTDNMATITAYSNDVSYECCFVEQLKNFAEPDDLVMAISGSGNSPNVLRAVEYANTLGCRTIGLTGRDGGQLAPLVQLNIHVASAHMGRIEDAHMVVCHMIGYYFMEENDSARRPARTGTASGTPQPR